MRNILEQQSRQLDVLAQEIARLNLLLEGRAPSAPGSATAAPAEEQAEPAQADHAPPAGNEASAPKAAPVAPDAASAPPGPVHTVAKGETLTAIAKHYKVTVSALLKLNKITDVRRLQIGETIHLPPNARLDGAPSPAAASTPEQ